MKDLTFQFERERGFLPERGFGIKWHGGCLGSAVGRTDERHMILGIDVGIYWWFKLSWAWWTR